MLYLDPILFTSPPQAIDADPCYAVKGHAVMESRERVVRAIGFSTPDRPPISHAILPSAQYKYGAALKQITDAVPEDFGWGLLPDLPA